MADSASWTTKPCGASKQEIIRTLLPCLSRLAKKKGLPSEVYKINLLMNKAKSTPPCARHRALSGAAPRYPAVLPRPWKSDDGTIVTGKTSSLLGSLCRSPVKRYQGLGDIRTMYTSLRRRPSSPSDLKDQIHGQPKPRLHTTRYSSP
ncbi:MAG: hypothetical protein ACLR0U_19465 [Enterocloster clostridioformis]